MARKIQYISHERLAVCRVCPEYDARRQFCRASTVCLAPSLRQRLNYCNSDDYDNCPIYLCKALRSSTPQGLDRENTLESGK